MRRSLLLALALPVASVAGRQPPLGRALDDPTRKVTGSGRLPAGWTMRFDPIAAHSRRPATPPPRPADVSVEAAGDGLHIRSGPAAVYYRPTDVAGGAFTVSATFTQTASMKHEAYGLVIGGTHLEDSTERYLYFVVRPQDGGILVNRRTSDARPVAVVPWTTDPAVNREHPRDGRATNRLAIRVERDSVWFLANGRLVRGLSRADLGGASTEGIVGLRVNHNLDLRVSGFRVERRR